MADKHPYTTAQGHLVQVIRHFRNSFPPTVTAGTLKKLGFAPKNESYVLNVLRFLELIDQEGKRTELAAKIFSLHDDDAFSKEFGIQVTKSYSDLFDLHGENAWGLNIDTLISFFRTSDGTTALVGKLQALTFQMLASFSGHGDIPEPRTGSIKSSATSATKKTKKVKTSISATSTSQTQNQTDSSKKVSNVGLTVRIEINLPADGDQETYDRIFRSIREYLLNE
jgi:uncharacterized protein DUF5343